MKHHLNLTRFVVLYLLAIFPRPPPTDWSIDPEQLRRRGQSRHETAHSKQPLRSAHRLPAAAFEVIDTSVEGSDNHPPHE